MDYSTLVMLSYDKDISKLEIELSRLRFERQKYLVRSNSLMEENNNIKQKNRLLVYFVLVTLIFLILEVLDVTNIMYFFNSESNNYKRVHVEENITVLEEKTSTIENNNDRKKDVYRVQIASFFGVQHEKIIPYEVNNFYIIDKNGRISLCVGSFDDRDRAFDFCEMMRSVGIRDAFVVYDNGTSISMVK